MAGQNGRQVVVFAATCITIAGNLLKRDVHMSGRAFGYGYSIVALAGLALGALLIGAAGCGGPAPGGELPVAAYATAAAQLQATATAAAPPSIGSQAATAAPSAGLPSAGATPVSSPAPPGATAATAAATGVASPVAAASFDPVGLAAQMLDLINRDRAAAGLAAVAWDEAAAGVAAAHVADMAAHDYFSHWNPDGLGPDHRYSAAGGQHAAMENLYAYVSAFADGRGAPIADWPAVIDAAQASLMASPGHRANILSPAHTHVGIGMAYDPDTGRLWLAQEFVNQYVTLAASLPDAAAPGAAIRVAGAFGPAALGNALLVLAYEPLPAPLSAAELAARSTYQSAAQSLDIRAIPLTFDETITLPAGPPGLYHLRLAVDTATGQAVVVDHVITVR